MKEVNSVLASLKVEHDCVATGLPPETAAFSKFYKKMQRAAPKPTVYALL